MLVIPGALGGRPGKEIKPELTNKINTWDSSFVSTKSYGTGRIMGKLLVSLLFEAGQAYNCIKRE